MQYDRISKYINQFFISKEDTTMRFSLETLHADTANLNREQLEERMNAYTVALLAGYGKYSGQEAIHEMFNRHLAVPIEFFAKCYDNCTISYCQQGLDTTKPVFVSRQIIEKCPCCGNPHYGLVALNNVVATKRGYVSRLHLDIERRAIIIKSQANEQPHLPSH